MKLSQFFSAAAFAALLLVNGCDTSGSDPIITPEIAPALSATIDGRPWSATGPETADSRIYAHRVQLGSKLWITATRTENGMTDELQLRISSPKEGVNLLRPEADPEPGRFNPGNPSDSLIFMTASDSGQVIINQFDELTTRISGSFWFTAKDNDGRTASVTNGTFKDVYIRP